MSIVDKLDEFYGPGFKVVLVKASAVIGGSFVISCALNTSWPGQDIDIYIPNNSKGLFNYIRDTVGGIRVIYSLYKGTQKKKEKTYSRCYKVYTPCGVDMNIIVVKDPINYILNNTDLTICESWFSFREFFIHPDVYNMKATIVNGLNEPFLEDLSENHKGPSYSHYQNFKRKRNLRLVKYMDRGFDINARITQGDILEYQEHLKVRARVDEIMIEKVYRVMQAITHMDFTFCYPHKNSSYESFSKRLKHEVLHFVPYDEELFPGMKMLSFDLFPFLLKWLPRYREWERVNEDKANSWLEDIYSWNTFRLDPLKFDFSNIRSEMDLKQAEFERKKHLLTF